MRRILIDWIIEVHFNFKHLDTTLNITVYLLDYVSNLLPEINKNNYQLIGTVCSKLADVLNENSREYYKQNNSTEYSALTNRSSTPIQIVNMEKNILQATNFFIQMATPIHFIQILTQVLGTNINVAMTARL